MATIKQKWFGISVSECGDCVNGWCSAIHGVTCGCDIGYAGHRCDIGTL